MTLSSRLTPQDFRYDPLESTQTFLDALVDPERPRLDGRGVLVVVAHPDDETIGLGAQLPRLPGIGLVHVTDGAPRDARDATAAGFASPGAYAQARRAELEAAMALAGVPADALVSLGVPDQEAFRDLAGIARRLAALMRERGTGIVLTHAYEGGHPDHDACAFAVAAACALRAGEGGAPAVIEMPYYSLAPDGGWRLQAFADEGPQEIAIALAPEERRLKAAMLAAHATQARVLSSLSSGTERFRPAPPRDHRVLPNGGALLYERQGWGLTGALWRKAVAAARAELGIGAVA
jgi:LmbE family N-acetylglucosaminyl deacetylase